jgi:hypothetical protein
MGRSRSATCVIMYIMKRFGVSFEDALEFVKHRREDVDPNEGFLSQLREFESVEMDFGRMLFNRQRQPRATEPPVISEIAEQEEELVVAEIIEEAMI